jgi:hypothetical protein
MSHMLDLIRVSALPSHRMMAAAKGNLGLSPAETLEILVYLAEHSKIFQDTARLTLAGWDEAASKQVAADPGAPKAILDYWLSPRNIRPALFPILIENPSVLPRQLAELAAVVKGELADAMLRSPRLKGSSGCLRALGANRELTPEQADRLRALTGGPDPAASEVRTETGATDPAADGQAETAVTTFFVEHAGEIAAQGEQPFQPIGGFEEQLPSETPQKAAAVAAPAGLVRPGVPPKPQVSHQPNDRQSALQKISKLDVKARIQLAIKGNKEERSILVRDGTKLVATAVLDSPKIGDNEVEKIASQRNVLEAVLRAIPMKRRFAKNYVVVRNLVFNPRTPIDVSLGLVKNLLTADLRNLSDSKEVAQTVRKAGLRLFKQKMEANKKE